MRVTLPLTTALVAVAASVPVTTALPINLDPYSLMTWTSRGLRDLFAASASTRQLAGDGPAVMNPGPIKVPIAHGPIPKPIKPFNVNGSSVGPNTNRLGVKAAVKPLPGGPNYVANPPKQRTRLNSTNLGLPIQAESTDPRFILYGDLYFQEDIAGVPPVAKVKGFTHYNVAFWLATDGPQDNALAWVQATDAQRKKVKQDYHNAGIKLMVSAFGATDTPQSGKGLGNATKTANRLADFVIKYGFDGVDVDYEEMDLFAEGKSVPWLIELTKQLRRRLPHGKYIITHAPIAPWFSADVYHDGGYTAVEKHAGSAIDWYNVQFYNQGPASFVTCDGLIWEGPQDFPSTSVFEIAKYGGVPINKIVIGKPALPSDASNGYMSKAALGKCAQEASNNGWSSGLMWWEYSRSFGGAQLARVLHYFTSG